MNHNHTLILFVPQRTLNQRREIMNNKEYRERIQKMCRQADKK